MPQIEQTYTYASQIFWLIISFSLLYGLMRFLLIPRLLGILNARVNQVASDLERASTARQDAVEVLGAYERIMSTAQKKSDLRVREVFEAQMEMIKTESEKLQVDLDKKFAEAEQRIEDARMQAFTDIETVVQPIVHTLLARTSDNLIEVSRARMLAEIRHGTRE